jgi:hypothetical protein
MSRGRKAEIYDFSMKNFTKAGEEETGENIVTARILSLLLFIEESGKIFLRKILFHFSYPIFSRKLFIHFCAD